MNLIELRKFRVSENFLTQKVDCYQHNHQSILINELNLGVIDENRTSIITKLEKYQSFVGSKKLFQYGIL